MDMSELAEILLTQPYEMTRGRRIYIEPWLVQASSQVQLLAKCNVLAHITVPSSLTRQLEVSRRVSTNNVSIELLEALDISVRRMRVPLWCSI
jgi:hypothetical protein